MNNKLKKKIILIGILILFIVILALSYAILRTQRPQQQISDTLPVCTNAASCSWNEVAGANVYEVKITDTSDGSVIKDVSTPASTRTVTFTPVPGRTYKCDVTVVNNCGNTSTGTATQACPLLSSTPSTTPPATATLTPPVTLPPNVTATNTPTPTRTPTPTVTRTPTIPVTRTPTKIPTKAPTATPTKAPTATPTKVPTKAPTATPTRVPTVTASPSATMTPTIFVATNTPIPPTSAPIVQATPRPTIPPTGSIAQTIGIVSVVVLSILGGAFLFIL